MCGLLLGGCADTAAGGPETYIVRPQDTLYSIAWRHDLDYRDLARWNNIGGDFRISVGQALVLGPGRVPVPQHAPPRPAAPPAVAGSSAAADAPRVSKPRPLPTVPPSTAQAPPTAQATPLAVKVPPPALLPPPSVQPIAPQAPPALLPPAISVPATGVASKWVWPTDRIGAPRPVPGGGILLSGRLGQDVRAASAGRVVYRGNGLRGYGNLIIIKHADSVLSAYAHNREMLVHDGQDVATGQVIAHMGEGSPQSPVLYFEIRQNGRPVDPLPFLTKVK
jgi:lipoprotein NlpD